MSSYEARRRENIRCNQRLVRDIGLQSELPIGPGTETSPTVPVPQDHTTKRRRLHPPRPGTRTSARIADTHNRPNYVEASRVDVPAPRSRSKNSQLNQAEPTTVTTSEGTESDIESLKASWSSWTPSAPPPTRDEQGNYHFESHPSFTPNKSPESVIREGSFGGSYWRPLYSRHLRATVVDDWKELPRSWTAGLSVEYYLTSATYNPEINKYGVSCGQSIEEWEASGWIAHKYDVRGWFQWYCRYWMGRRCDDDERQISRWQRCVGERGRWRRTLLKQYVRNGLRTVTDEDDEMGEKKDVSPVVHQTCHHWAWEVRQEVLDRFWDNE
ncbi:hypothetical protein GGS20DRAFT_567787 [Poronia punctata]|nr:hypothetical protein GGS20DRAFT_567787 [Poronia punctata]